MQKRLNGTFSRHIVQVKPSSSYKRSRNTYTYILPGP